MRRVLVAVMVYAVGVAFAPVAFAQGGGASSTGVIQGRVADAQGAVLPGVTVTATSPSLIGQQTAVTSENGNYRFPAVPPGVYALSFELTGFNTVRREGIQIALGFTANVNIEMALATLQETVTVTGDSPIIDTSATRTVQTFKAEQLASIPNGRDLWSLLAVTPAVQLSRIDVGGNRAGTQTGYTAYGLNGQVRVLVEGINTTEGTAASGVYFDYGSVEEAFLGTAGQSAEMPTPGVQSQFVTRSGGNRFGGEIYQDWYNNSLQGSNLSDEVIGLGIRKGSNEMQGYRDTALNVGGPVKKDKIWWNAAYRQQQNQVAQPNFRFDKTFDTKLTNPSTKWTYQMNQNNKLIGYYQAGLKLQPNRLPFATYFYDNEGETWKQQNVAWVYKGEWNGTLSDKLYVEARYGDFGYYFPLLSNGDATYGWRDTALGEIEGSYYTWQIDRDRKQATGAATYFLDKGKGSHTFKFGGELLKETAWEGYLAQSGKDPAAPYGMIDHQYANGVSTNVVFRIPTAINHLGGLKDNDNGNILSIANVGQLGAFFTDSWVLGRLTVNAGMRYDRYRSYTPEQRQIAFTTGPVSVAAQSFPEVTYATWNSVVPRIGVTFDLSGDGRTVIKANYGLYVSQPRCGHGERCQRQPAEQDRHVCLERRQWRQALAGWRGRRRADGDQPGRHHQGRSRDSAALFARRWRVPRTSVRRGPRVSRRLRDEDRGRPVCELPGATSGVCLLSRVSVRRRGCRRRSRNRRRPRPDPVRHADEPGRRLPGQQHGDEHWPLLALQDRGGVGEQAPWRSVVGRCRRQLHDAAGLSTGISQHPECAGHAGAVDLGRQADRLDRCAIRHQGHPCATASIRPKLCAHHLGRPVGRDTLWADLQRHHLRRR